MISRRQLLATGGAIAASVPGYAWSDVYPTKPVTVIVPFAPGGPTDVMARVLCRKMGEVLGQQIVVENVTGAAGIVGVSRAAKASPDGYTLLFTHMGTLAVNIALYKSLPYDSQKDLEPVGLGGTNPMVLIARKGLPANTFSEFMAYVQLNQKTSQYGMAGVGSASHLSALMLNRMMKVEVLEVPYKGTAPALNDLRSGQIDYMLDQAVTVLGHIQSGSIKALGVSTRKRLQQLPDVPTIDEAGLTGYDVTIWNAFFAPKNTPGQIISSLNAAMTRAIADDHVRTRLTELAVVLPTSEEATPAALRDLLHASIEKWVSAVRAAGVPLQ